MFLASCAHAVFAPRFRVCAQTKCLRMQGYDGAHMCAARAGFLHLNEECDSHIRFTEKTVFLLYVRFFLPCYLSREPLQSFISDASWKLHALEVVFLHAGIHVQSSPNSHLRNAVGWYRLPRGLRFAVPGTWGRLLAREGHVSSGE